MTASRGFYDGSMSNSALVASWGFRLFLGLLVGFVKLASIYTYKILILFFMTYKNKKNKYN